MNNKTNAFGLTALVLIASLPRVSAAADAEQAAYEAIQKVKAYREKVVTLNDVCKNVNGADLKALGAKFEIDLQVVTNTGDGAPKLETVKNRASAAQTARKQSLGVISSASGQANDSTKMTDAARSAAASQAGELATSCVAGADYSAKGFQSDVVDNINAIGGAPAGKTIDEQQSRDKCVAAAQRLLPEGKTLVADIKGIGEQCKKDSIADAGTSMSMTSMIGYGVAIAGVAGVAGYMIGKSGSKSKSKSSKSKSFDPAKSVTENVGPTNQIGGGAPSDNTQVVGTAAGGPSVDASATPVSGDTPAVAAIPRTAAVSSTRSGSSGAFTTAAVNSPTAGGSRSIAALTLDSKGHPVSAMAAKDGLQGSAIAASADSAVAPALADPAVAPPSNGTTSSNYVEKDGSSKQNVWRFDKVKKRWVAVANPRYVAPRKRSVDDALLGGSRRANR